MESRPIFVARRKGKRVIIWRSVLIVSCGMLLTQALALIPLYVAEAKLSSFVFLGLMGFTGFVVPLVCMILVEYRLPVEYLRDLEAPRDVS